MANDEHVALLKQGVDAWNAWRDENRDVDPDLCAANLTNVDLTGANLCGANLRQADLTDANLREVDLAPNIDRLWGGGRIYADLTNAVLIGANFHDADLGGAILDGANLAHANLLEANLHGAHFEGANLEYAHLYKVYLGEAHLRRAYLHKAHLREADLRQADLRQADLTSANLFGANLNDANLSEAKLGGADLSKATLVNTDLTGADLTGCRIYGVSAWGLKLERTKQQNLVITPEKEPEVTVDNIEVAQFIYLMLNNQNIRGVIDTITSKAVLILGRFTNERKAVLDALREELRKRDYLPILFDFEKPRSRDTDETITLLARMARFIVADISDAKSVLQELRAIVPDLPSVPVQPVILEMQEEPGMFDFYRNRPSFLPVHRYVSQEQLLADLGEKVIRPAELKVLDLRAST
jgi:uncharacterized protein YjbI with pentapeptide repeats